MTALTDPTKTFGEVSEAYGIPESTLKTWAKAYPKESAA